MIGVPTLVASGGYDQFQGYLRSIAKARKAVTKNDIEGEQETLMDNTVASSAPASTTVGLVHSLTMDAIRWISEGFLGRLIRRTANSKNWQGNPLNNLSEPQRLHVFIKTSDADINRLHQIQEEEGKQRHVPIS